MRRRRTSQAATQATTGPAAGTFDRARFDRQKRNDALMNRSLGVIAGCALLVALLLPSVGLPGIWAVLSLAAPIVLLACWLVLTQTTAQVGRVLPMISELIERDPAAAQLAIDKALSRYPVLRWARLLTYHRLATLRHRQRRFDEAAEICYALLCEELRGPAASVKPHLLLMLAESKLETRDRAGAYHALDSLYHTRLSLVEALQRLALQTRYELMIGAHGSALHQGKRKIELAELMPLAQCGAMHAMLAYAAEQSGQDRIARWLWERTKLISPPALLAQFERGGFNLGVVEAQSEDRPD